MPLQWRHNERDGVSNHQPYDCLLNRLFRRRSKETSKQRVTGLCAGKSPVTSEFPAQRARNAKKKPNTKQKNNKKPRKTKHCNLTHMKEILELSE